MNNKINIILKRLALFIMYCFLICEVRLAESPQLTSYLIVPNLRVGAITPRTSESELQRVYGRRNVRRAKVEIGEGERQSGAVIYPDDPAKTIEVIWKDVHRRRHPERIQLTGKQSVWRTRQGISLGTSLKELERINGRPFVLMGFGWDYAGTVVSWNGGELEKEFEKGGRITLRLDGSNHEEEGKVAGEQDFSSHHRVMQRINPKVYQIIVTFPEGQWH